MIKTMDAEENGYDLELDEVCKTIKEKEYRTILLQFPEGLKKLATEVKDLLEERTNTDVIIYADPCYGACDLPLHLNYLGIDFLVQFGHTKIPNLQFPVPTMFIEAHSNLDVLPVVKKAVRHLQSNVGMITTA